MDLYNTTLRAIADRDSLGAIEAFDCLLAVEFADQGVDLLTLGYEFMDLVSAGLWFAAAALLESIIIE